MELLIDTKKKSVLIKNEINLKDLLDFMKRHFKDDWTEWKITSVQTEYCYPVPWWSPYYEYDLRPFLVEYTTPIDGTGQPLPNNQTVMCVTFN